MVLKKPATKPKIEDLANWYAPGAGMTPEALIQQATDLARKKGIEDADALFLIVEETKRVQAVVTPLTEWKAQARKEHETPSFLALCAVLYEKDNKVEVRHIRAYPDTADDVESVTGARPGSIVKPQNVWALKQKGTEIEITDDSPSRRGIFGAKRFGTSEDKGVMANDEIAVKIAEDYKKMFNIVDKAAEKFDKAIEKAEGSFFEKVTSAINGFETAKIVILNHPRIPQKRSDIPDAQARKPRLECSGLVDVRGVMCVREFALYYETETERLNAKASMKIPVLGTSQNFFELRANAEDGTSTHMTDALGNVKLGVKGLRKEKEGAEVVNMFKSKYVNVLDLCDAKSDKYEKPLVLPEGQLVEFSDMGFAPFLIVNAAMSSVDDKKNKAVLRVVMTDGKRKVDGALYGAAALDLVGADSLESFLPAVRDVDGACIKDVFMYISRTWHVNEKSDKKEPVFHFSIQGVHQYVDATEQEMNALYAH